MSCLHWGTLDCWLCLSWVAKSHASHISKLHPVRQRLRNKAHRGLISLTDPCVPSQRVPNSRIGRGRPQLSYCPFVTPKLTLWSRSCALSFAKLSSPSLSREVARIKEELKEARVRHLGRDSPLFPFSLKIRWYFSCSYEMHLFWHKGGSDGTNPAGPAPC